MAMSLLRALTFSLSCLLTQRGNASKDVGRSITSPSLFPSFLSHAFASPHLRLLTPHSSNSSPSAPFSRRFELPSRCILPSSVLPSFRDVVGSGFCNPDTQPSASWHQWFGKAISLVREKNFPNQPRLTAKATRTVRIVKHPK